MENRITIKFIHGFRPYVAGDIATVSKDEANRLIRYGYAEILVSAEEKTADALAEIADPESISTDPEKTEPEADASAQDQATTEPETETEKQADTAPTEDRAIHGPKKKTSKK